MANSFSSSTDAGDIIVEEWVDSTYPGLTVYLDRGDGYKNQVAVVECDKEGAPDEIHVRVWYDDAGDPDFTAEYEDLEGSEVFHCDFEIDTPAGVIQAEQTNEGCWIYVNRALVLRAVCELDELVVDVWAYGTDGLDYELRM